MGFFDRLMESTPRGKLMKRLEGRDFVIDKEYWEGNGSKGVLVDTANNRIALLEYREIGITERLQIISKLDVKGKGFREQNNINEAAIKAAQEQVRIYRCSDILRSDVAEDGNSITYTKRMSQIGSALVGDILVGGLGFVVGGLSGKKKNINTASNVSVNIVVKDTSKPLFTIKFLDKEKEKKSKDYQLAIQNANTLHSLISVLIDQADKEDEDVVSTNLSSKTNSIADELMKLSQLQEKGIITNEEFATLKSNMLSKLS